MKIHHFLSLAFVVALLGACATPMKISVDHNPDADFSDLKTYNWLPEPQKKAGDPRVDNELMDKRVRITVEAQLNSMGYEKVTEGKPDFKLGYYVAIKEKTDVTYINNYYGYGPGWHTNPAAGPGYAPVQPVEVTYEVGTLIVDVVDSETNELMWRGWAQAEINTVKPPKEEGKQLKEAVQKIFAQFPPQ